MKCENCKQNEASFHSITNINGKVTEKHLCVECARKNGEFENKVENFFQDFMTDFQSSLSFFTDPISSLSFDNLFENEEINDKLIKEREEKIGLKRREIQKLDLELKKAVVEERYEDAIVLRDKIKKLKEDKE